MEIRLKTRPLACVFLLIAGCSTAQQPTPRSGPSPTHQATPRASVTPPQPPPTPTPAPSPWPALDRPLSAVGPWWVYNTPEGIWGVEADGSALALVLDRTPGTVERTFQFVPSPAGGLLAVIEIENIYERTPPQLYLLRLPDGEVTPVAQLHPGGVDPSDAVAVDRWAATGPRNSLAWSPDGSRLAFNAVIDGDTGDLYVYSLADGSLSRLTTGPTESALPVWAPDGTRIVHASVERVYYEYSGRGYDYTGVWSAMADGSGVELLSETRFYGFETVLGWLSDTAMLMDTESIQENMACPLRDLRTFDLLTHRSTTLVHLRYSSRAYDPESATVLLGVPADPACEGGLAPGVYRVDVRAGGPAEPVLEGDVIDLEWSAEAGQFFVWTAGGVVAIDPSSGAVLELVRPGPASGLPIAAAGSRRLAWTGDEVWIGNLTDGTDFRAIKVLDESAPVISWSPDGRNLLMMASSGLFVASEPEFTAHPVFFLTGFGTAWVLPASN